jgi:hypothetical protein
MAITMAALVIRTAVRFRGSQIHSKFNMDFGGTTDYPIIRPVPKPNQKIGRFDCRFRNRRISRFGVNWALFYWPSESTD